MNRIEKIDNFASLTIAFEITRTKQFVCQFHTRPNGILTCLSGARIIIREGEKKRRAFFFELCLRGWDAKINDPLFLAPRRDLFNDREITIGDFLFLAGE